MMLLGTAVVMPNASLAPQPAQKCVAIRPYHVRKLGRAQFEQEFLTDAINRSARGVGFLGMARAFLLLRRRNDVTMYGKLHNQYPTTTPDYCGMRIFSDHEMATSVDVSDVPEELLWDATMLQRPPIAAELEPGTPLFLAMNRFPVLSDRALLFEERWASRESQLYRQPGLIGFSLLRRRNPPLLTADDIDTAVTQYTYSTATLWASEAAWQAWREGGGRNTHAKSQELVKSGQRTPVSEWMAGNASPIFWDVPFYAHHSGMMHVCADMKGSRDVEAASQTQAHEKILFS